MQKLVPALIIVQILLFSSCFSSKEMNEKKIDNIEVVTSNVKILSEMEIKNIEYRFGDSSVPPKYHRSYTITATQNQLNVVVDSYGKVLAEQTTDISSTQFIELTELLKNVKSQELGNNSGCTGGTSESLSYFSAEKEEFSASVYHCGGEDSGTLSGDVITLKKAMQALVPNFHSLLLN